MKGYLTVEAAKQQEKKLNRKGREVMYIYFPL